MAYKYLPVPWQVVFSFRNDKGKVTNEDPGTEDAVADDVFVAKPIKPHSQLQGEPTSVQQALSQTPCKFQAGVEVGANAFSNLKWETTVEECRGGEDECQKICEPRDTCRVARKHESYGFYQCKDKLCKDISEDKCPERCVVAYFWPSDDWGNPTGCKEQRCAEKSKLDVQESNDFMPWAFESQKDCCAKLKTMLPEAVPVPEWCE